MTSRSHPLRVDNLAIDGLRGVIGLTFCPGKKQPGAMSGDWERDLAADLDAIRSSGDSTASIAGQLWGGQ
jgi:ADP-ribosyl-[dinitrogen reductase] hydrolase